MNALAPIIDLAPALVVLPGARAAVADGAGVRRIRAGEAESLLTRGKVLLAHASMTARRLGLPPAPRFVFVNGLLAPGLSDPAGLPEGVTLEPLSRTLARGEAREVEFLARRYTRPDDAFARLNTALAVEGMVGTFKSLHENPAMLPNAAAVLAATALLLAAWGVFIRLNRSAEELEPEAMEEAKREDAKLDKS